MAVTTHIQRESLLEITARVQGFKEFFEAYTCLDTDPTGQGSFWTRIISDEDPTEQGSLSKKILVL
jgi:hypothetical protein